MSLRANLAAAALVLLSCLALWPGVVSIPVTDRDEARFAQASRQMVESGDPIEIRLGAEPRLKKPVGIYWLQATAALASGAGAEAPLWVFRLPSQIGAMVATGLTALIGAMLFGWRQGLAAAALLAATLVLGAEARIAKTDAMLLATIVAAQAVLARLHLRPAAPPRAAVFGFWLALAASVLIKGPIGPAIVALTALSLAALRRDLAWLRPLAAPLPIGLALTLALPWFIAITLRLGTGFWTGSVGADLLPKIASGSEGKGAPPGTYLALLWFTFWPAAALLPLALRGIWRERHTVAVQFLAAWALPYWLLLEAVPTKLLHYPLPLYPALALAVAAFAPAGLQAAGKIARGAAMLAALAGPLLGGAVLVHALQTGAGPDALRPIGAGLAGSLVLLALLLHAILRRQDRGLVPLAVLSALALWVGLFSGLGRIDALWPGQRAAESAARAAAQEGCARPGLIGWGYAEPSLLWLGGRDTPLIAARDALPGALVRAPCSFVLRAQTTPPPPPACRSLGQFSGFAIGAGKPVTLDLLRCREEG